MTTAVPNVAEIEERQRRISQMLQRMATMTPEEAERFSASLRAQQSIEDATGGSGIPTGENSATTEALRTALASREEVVRTNLTSTLGFAPTRQDINELLAMRRTMGDSFAQTAISLGRVVNTVEGGIASVLMAIDNGVSSAIQGVINQADALAQQARKEAEEAFNSALVSVRSQTESLIPQEARDLAQDIANIPNAINSIVVSATDSINRTIDDINGELNSISTSLQNEAREFIDSNINRPIQDAFSSAISGAITQTPLPPPPRNEAGEEYATGGGVLLPGDSTAPIVSQ